MVKRKVLMELVPLPEGLDGAGMVYFAHQHPDLADQLADSLVIPEQTWVEFGRPTELTITVEPGDRMGDDG